MALRNYMYSKHNNDNNINTMIFHKDSHKQSSSSVNTADSARDTSTTLNEDKVNTENVNDDERSKTLVSHAMENKIEELNTEEHNLRNDSITTLNSVSEVSNTESVHNSTNNLAA